MKKIVFTIITKNYLWAARALVHQLELHGDNSELFVCVVDLDENAGDVICGSASVISGATLVDKEKFNYLSFIYSPFELCCVLRPYAHKFFFSEENPDRLLFLDSDIYITSNVWQPFERFIDQQIILSSHIFTPSSPEDSDILEGNLLKHGVYNGGVLQLNAGENTEKFLDWFENRLFSRGDSFDSSDQIWLNLVPLFFEGVAVVTNPGVNVGWWNLHERLISKTDDGRFWVNGHPLHSLHLSHWSPKNPTVFSSHYPELKPSVEWLELAGQYASLCKNYGFAASMQIPYGFAKFDDGKPIESWMRRHYKERTVSNNNPLDKSPFASSVYFEGLMEDKGRQKKKSGIFSFWKKN